MCFPRLLPLAVISLMLAGASSAEARSNRSTSWSWFALSNRIQSVAHRLLLVPVALHERGGEDQSSSAPRTTWAKIKAGYRGGGNPPPPKD
jgi:hypothetical protein